MRITSAKPMPGFRLELAFDSGETGVVDLSELAGRGVLASWTLPEMFEQVKVTDVGTVEWPGEIDLCPDALYLRMTGKSANELFPSHQARSAHA
jgi:hypothetical protein